MMMHQHASVKIKTIMGRFLLFFTLIYQSQSFTTTTRIVTKIELRSTSIGYHHCTKRKRCGFFHTTSTSTNSDEIYLNRKWHSTVANIPSRTSLFGEIDAKATQESEIDTSTTNQSNDDENNDVNPINNLTVHKKVVNTHHILSNDTQSPLHMNAIEIKDEEESRRKEQKRKLKKQANRIKVSMAVSSMLTAFLLLIYLSGPGQWRYYLAGGICAAISHGITTPVDVIKTRKQLDESMKDMGLIKAGVKLIKDDTKGGIRALLAGLGPTTIGYLFEGAVKFGVYEVSKPMVRSLLIGVATLTNLSFIDSKLLGFVISGTLAGTAASIMLCPMEALRIRLVAEPEFAATGNWVDCGVKMINNEGIMGFFKSLPSMLFKQVPYTVAKNVSFDFITTSAYSAVAGLGYIICGRTKFIIPLISAMIASVISSISSQPGDMLLSVINARKGKLTTRDYIKSIMKENGIGGFFVGTRERLVHVGMIVTVQLLIYDFVKRLVGISATGL